MLISVIPTVEINPRLETDTEGKPVILECLGAVLPPKTTAQLANNLSIAWFGPDGQLLHNIKDDNFLFQEVTSNTSYGQTLTIVEATLENSGWYSCEATLKLSDIKTHTVSSDYHLIFYSKLLPNHYVLFVLIWYL